MKTININNEVIKLVNILHQIKNGLIKTRFNNLEFNKEDVLKLLDSLSKSYPTGNIIFYKSNEMYDNNLFGRCSITQKSDNTLYILDGNRRLIILFNTIYNLNNINKYHFYGDIFDVYYDLENEKFTYLNGVENNILLVPTNILLDTFCILDYEDKLKKTLDDKKVELYMKRLKMLSTTFADTSIFCSTIKNCDEKTINEIKNRIK